VCCSVLQWETAAMFADCTQYASIAMQHIASHCNQLQYTATYCTRQQHTATHCNTLQHTATVAATWCQLSSFLLCGCLPFFVPRHASQIQRVHRSRCLTMFCASNYWFIFKFNFFQTCVATATCQCLSFLWRDMCVCVVWTDILWVSRHSCRSMSSWCLSTQHENMSSWSLSRISSLLQNIVSFIGLFCKRDLWFYRSYYPTPPHIWEPHINLLLLLMRLLPLRGLR